MTSKIEKDTARALFKELVLTILRLAPKIRALGKTVDLIEQCPPSCPFGDICAEWEAILPELHILESQVETIADNGTRAMLAVTILDGIDQLWDWEDSSD
ncbi:MAG: hypothetical protein DRN91_04760 [Candidatus Alkanophagales archaeon]|nr:MAG: hypothetical protein DRN91_04760 [Candidatus Alkanophagales archaeon]